MRRIFMLALFACLLAGCGSALAGRDIVLPEAEDVRGVTVTWESDRVASSRDAACIAQLLEAMKGAKNTGSASVQDVPDGGAWLARIDFDHQDMGISTVFLYPKGGKLLLEQPYQGVYEADSSLAALVREVGK